MKARNTMRACTTLLAAALTLTGMPATRAQGQDKDHAVSSGQLRKDVQKAAETRQANEAAVRQMFASEAARETLKSAGVHHKQVDQAISQVNDEDLARMAQRAHEVNKDFAGGTLGDRDLLIILLIAVAIILIVVAVR